MHLIVYTSEYLGDQTVIGEQLKEISTVAKRNNPQLGITGLLFFHAQRFLQIVEGEQEQLSELMDKLADDPRHTNIERLIDSPIEKRGFAQWNMDSFNLSDERALQEPELKTIAQAYKQNLQADSALIANFYKTMLKQKNFS